MKQFYWGAAALLLLAGTAIRLTHRWREESADRHVTLVVDWSEVRDNASRLGLTNDELLSRLKQSGANALLISPSTVQDYLWSDFTFSSRVFAETVIKQLSDRGVTGVTLATNKKTFRLLNAQKLWTPLKDMEIGFNPELLGKARQAGFNLVLRVNNDPWLAKDTLFADLQEIGAVNEKLGVLLNTDDIPGGKDALTSWVSFLEGQHYAQLLFEFHPSKAALKVGEKTPRSTFRAHAIPSNELRDLTPAQQQSRWKRAVEERSCRFLLVHASPSDALAGFLTSIETLHQDLLRHGWIVAWPKPRNTWSSPSLIERKLAPWIALWLAISVPIVALQIGIKMNRSPLGSYAKILLVTFLGACVMAAVAQNPLTRVEVTPFKGIKLAFTLSWAGSLLSLYSWVEIKKELFKVVRRVDVLVALLLTVVVGYLLIRTGNASAGWKTGWEQSVRDHLENFLIARPRFKEFAIGYPLLFLGLHWRPHPNPLPKGDRAHLNSYSASSPASLREGGKERVRRSLGRLLIGLGMLGPISMVNTFCHLHSPLYLAFLRSLNGMVLGTAIGFLGLSLYQRRMELS